MTTTRPAIRFVGDSITAQSEHEITAFFTAQQRYRSVSVDGVPGADTYQRQWAVYRDAQLALRTFTVGPRVAPDVEVINLGTNDTNHDTSQYPRRPVDTLHRLRVFASKALFPTACVVFVTINTHMPSWPPARAAYFNAQIRQFPHVADWDAAYDPSYFDSNDNVHPNDTGKHVLVNLIADAIDKC